MLMNSPPGRLLPNGHHPAFCLNEWNCTIFALCVYLMSLGTLSWRSLHVVAGVRISLTVKDEPSHCVRAPCLCVWPPCDVTGWVPPCGHCEWCWCGCECTCSRPCFQVFCTSTLKRTPGSYGVEKLPYCAHRCSTVSRSQQQVSLCPHDIGCFLGLFSTF